MVVITPPRSLPGVHSPAASFAQPFDMLAACHERLARSLGLLGRLMEHLDTAGPDSNARSAASDVWRYFELAAPQHHRDEELHLVPVLQASGDARLQQAAAQMLADHQQFRAVWQRLGPALAALRDGDPPARSVLQALAQRFIALHGPHLALEDTLVFPRLRPLLPEAVQQAMGAEMARRRGTSTALRMR